MAGYTPFVVDLILFVGIVVLAIGTYFAAKALLYMLDSMIQRTATTWDNELLNHRMLRSMARLAPALITNLLLPNFFTAESAFSHWAEVITSFYIIWTVVHIVNVGLDNLYNTLASRPSMRSYAIKGVFQMAKLIAIGMGVIVALSLLIGKTPLAIITAIGASAAVLMLVFKDTILGLVASVQLTANNMLHRGDWIRADKYEINGEVVDVSLTTVKVRNWDNSISTIPPYLLVADSFRNYQAMRDSGGRRMERSVLIDVNSVRFLTNSEIESLRNKGLLSGVDEAKIAKGAINLELLRLSIEAYLKQSPLIEQSMLSMVRQLEPTPRGLPLQIYCFTPATEWRQFEAVQGEIMNHVYATVREFGLIMFQSPSGLDLTQAINKPNNNH